MERQLPDSPAAERATGHLRDEHPSRAAQRGTTSPERRAGPARTGLRRLPGEDPSGEPVVELLPGGTPTALRVTGPGRTERSYLGRIEALEGELEQKAVAMQAAELVERGTSRFVDRMEAELTRDRQELEEVRSQGHRLMVVLGSLQRENERLIGELARSRALEAAGTPRAARGARGSMRRIARWVRSRGR